MVAWNWRRKQGVDWKGQRGTLIIKNVCILDCDGEYITVYKCQNSLNYH